MDNTNNPAQASDFSDIPALGDVTGLEAFMNAEALKAQGLPVAPTQPVQPTVPAQPAVTNTGDGQPDVQPAANQQAAQPGATTTAAQAPAASTDGSVTLTKEQFNALLAGRGTAQPAQQAQQRAPMYSAQEQLFISKALAQGYSLDQINKYLASRGGGQSAVEQRVAQVEQYLKQREYQAAEAEFVNRLSSFGEKWGLSEADLVTFGQEALKHGINIAGQNVDLETVFRAVYPDQYSIRLRRMTPTTSSQIYGGTNIPESNRATASKVEDAYVEAFLKGAMPNQYAAFKK